MNLTPDTKRVVCFLKSFARQFKVKLDGNLVLSSLVYSEYFNDVKPWNILEGVEIKYRDKSSLTAA